MKISKDFSHVLNSSNDEIRNIISLCLNNLNLAIVIGTGSFSSKSYHLNLGHDDFYFMLGSNNQMLYFVASRPVDFEPILAPKECRRILVWRPFNDQQHFLSVGFGQDILWETIWPQHKSFSSDMLHNSNQRFWGWAVHHAIGMSLTVRILNRITNEFKDTTTLDQLKDGTSSGWGSVDWFRRNAFIIFLVDML